MSDTPLFSVAAQSIDGCTQVTLAGEIDMSGVDDFDAVLRPLLDAERDEVVLDLQRLSYLDSSGVRALLILHAHAVKHDKTFRVCRASSTVDRVLRITDTADLLGLD